MKIRQDLYTVYPAEECRTKAHAARDIATAIREANTDTSDSRVWRNRERLAKVWIDVAQDWEQGARGRDLDPQELGYRMGLEGIQRALDNEAHVIGQYAHIVGMPQTHETGTDA